MNNGKDELSMEQMEQIGGGFVVSDKTEGKFWLVRQDGTVIAPVPTMEKAIEFAKAFSISDTVKTLEEYKEHFGRDLEW